MLPSTFFSEAYQVETIANNDIKKWFACFETSSVSLRQYLKVGINRLQNTARRRGPFPFWPVPEQILTTESHDLD